jgi:hypothetical protein
MGLLLLVSLAGMLPGQAKPVSPERRALAFLSREVPRWSSANHCYSCHNNGDGARALYAAVRLSYDLPSDALADTSRWLARPEKWDHNGGEGPANDRKLARLQFAAALAEAVDVGAVKDRRALTQAADYLAAQQQADGSWQAEGTPAIGTPATYNAALATYLACRTLRKADAERHRQALAKADVWFRKSTVNNLVEAAAVLLAITDAMGDDVAAQRQRCRELIARGQSPDGGWGPFATSPSEPFDTAIVLLALAGQGTTPDVLRQRERGRAFLIATQQSDGSWTETTRPAGAESYAQRLSTSAWATLALLAPAR